VATARIEFEIIRKNKLYEEVARRLEKFIREQLKPGDKLPPERQLTAMFGVSRSSVRDAIRALELIGLVEPRQGAGTVVRDLATHPPASPLTDALLTKRKQIDELLDVRLMLEPLLAARTAKHASAEELAEMEDILRRQKEKVSRSESTIEEDSEFHYNIALATGNSVILKIVDTLMDLLRDTRERSLQVEGRMQKSLAGHRRVLAALQRRDAAAAEAAMRHHLEEIKNLVLTP
jgi:GntR family transcriptional repressor for pyruvate dehydrogenase complex